MSRPVKMLYGIVKHNALLMWS